jgi:hypothetical protein
MLEEGRRQKQINEANYAVKKNGEGGTRRRRKHTKNQSIHIEHDERLNLFDFFFLLLLLFCRSEKRVVWPLGDLARGPPAWKNSGIQYDSSHTYIVLYFSSIFYNFCFLGTFHDAHHFVLCRLIL